MGTARAGTRAFEYLAAATDNSWTAAPGKNSFTTALIWALKDVVRTGSPGTTTDLITKIKTALNFPTSQKPVLMSRRNHKNRIILQPLVPIDTNLTMIIPQHLAELFDEVDPVRYLLLDLRIRPHFAHSRIRGALNLCVPSTLLKRPSFNVQKLSEVFTTDDEREKFAQWQRVNLIIVYDEQSARLENIPASGNIVNKFIAEGWQGTSYVIQGGFLETMKGFPELIDNRRTSEKEGFDESRLPEDDPDVPKPMDLKQEVLTLRFVFDNRPQLADIEGLGKELHAVVTKLNLPMSQIRWDGLTAMPHDRAYEAAKRRFMELDDDFEMPSQAKKTHRMDWSLVDIQPSARNSRIHNLVILAVDTFLKLVRKRHNKTRVDDLVISAADAFLKPVRRRRYKAARSGTRPMCVESYVGLAEKWISGALATSKILLFVLLLLRSIIVMLGSLFSSGRSTIWF